MKQRTTKEQKQIDFKPRNTQNTRNKSSGGPVNTLRVPIALTDTGDVITASNAPKGNGFYCPLCHDPVILKKGAVRIPHFAHKISLTCSPETVIHKSAKLLIEKVIRDWKAGNGPAPAIVRKCPQCGFTKQQAIPDKVEKTVQEYALPSGRIADVALIAYDQPVLSVEVHVTHKVDEQKAGDIGVKYIEVEGEAIIADPLTWQPMAEKLNEWLCPECIRKKTIYEKKRTIIYEKFRKKVHQIAAATNITLPTSFFRYSFLRCYRCKRDTLVYAWPKVFEEGNGRRITIVNVPASVKQVHSKTRGRGYWTNTCAYCNAKIGNHFLYQPYTGPFFGFEISSDFEADLMQLAAIKFLESA